MGLELELSELGVIRPIRTAVTSTDGATPTRPPGSDGEVDAADTGYVTPTAAAAAASPMPQQSGVDDVDAGCVTPTVVASSSPMEGDAEDDNSGCVTPTMARRPAPGQQRGGGVDASCCVTPTAAASVLRPSTECPPAPRKPARSPVVPKRKLYCGGGGGAAPRRCFFPVPRDLTKVFVARGPAADSSPPPRDAKKMRVHPVG